MRQRVRILNGAFDALTKSETVEAVFRALNAGTRGWLCTVNVAMLVMMRSDPKLQSFIDRAMFVVADGQPLVWCAPLFDRQLPERVAGIDLIDLLCARAEVEGKGVYLLGATEARHFAQFDESALRQMLDNLLTARPANRSLKTI